jgi:hypothetical protein
LLAGAPHAVFPFAGAEFPVPFELAPRLPLAEFGVMSRIVVSLAGGAGFGAGAFRLLARLLARFAFPAFPVERLPLAFGPAVERVFPVEWLALSWLAGRAAGVGAGSEDAGAE